MLGDKLRRVVTPDIGDADAHQAIRLSDQVAQCRRHAAVAGRMRQRGMKGAVIGDEVFVVAGKTPEFIQRLQNIIRGILDRFRDASRLQREAESQEVTRVGKRDRIDPVTLARLHRDEMLALQPQQRLSHRLAADGVAFGKLLLAHIIARRQPAGQNIRTEVFVDIVAQKHRNFPGRCPNLAAVKYHVK